MATKFQVTVVKSGNGLWIVLPKPICDGNSIRKGDTLVLIEDNDKIIIPLDKIEHRPVAVALRKIESAQDRSKKTTL
jgi:hypothetical protein